MAVSLHWRASSSISSWVAVMTTSQLEPVAKLEKTLIPYQNHPPSSRGFRAVNKLTGTHLWNIPLILSHNSVTIFKRIYETAVHQVIDVVTSKHIPIIEKVYAFTCNVESLTADPPKYTEYFRTISRAKFERALKPFASGVRHNSSSVSNVVDKQPYSNKLMDHKQP